MEKHFGYTDELSKRWGWILAAGVSYLVLGTLAALLPVVSTVGITIMLGAIFFASGAVQFVHAVQLRKHEGAMTRFIQALIATAAGAFIFWQPGVGMLGISLTLGVYFFVSAAMQIATAQSMTSKRLRFWRYLGAATLAVLGFFILFSFPISARWIPGMLFGIGLISEGAELVGFAFEVRKPTSAISGRGLDYAVRTN